MSTQPLRERLDLEALERRLQALAVEHDRQDQPAHDESEYYRGLSTAYGFAAEWLREELAKD